MPCINMQPQTVNIKSPTNTRDGSGGQVASYSTVYSSEPAWIQPISASWLMRYQQRQIDVTHTVLFNRLVTVTNGDQITYGTRTFLVIGIRNVLEANRLLAVDVKEILT